MKYRISGLYVYPIKSLGGVTLDEVVISKSGLNLDRKWMLVNDGGGFLSQRNLPKMALFKCELLDQSVKVIFENDSILIPIQNTPNEKIQVSIWEDKVHAFSVSEKINQWFSKHLEKEVRLVERMPEYKRLVKNHEDSHINFADSAPILITGESSLLHLNSKLDTTVNLDRFRANIVYSGGEPHIDDNWTDLAINNEKLSHVKPCARCRIITIDQATGELDFTPMGVLGEYRRKDRKVYFGNYFKLDESTAASIKVGDYINVL